MEEQLKQIRTFQGDAAEALKDQNESVVSLRREELIKQGGGNEFAPRPTPAEELEKKNREKVILLLIGSLVLLAIGGWGIFYTYNSYKTKSALPIVVIVPNKFISTENNIELKTPLGVREEFLNSLISEINEPLKEGAIKQIQLNSGVGTTTSLTNTTQFFRALNSKAPASLVRAFDPLFMLGVLKENTNHTFLLIKLDSFENAFPGMLSWETNMADDILPLFASTSTVATLPSNTSFVDVTIQNKDARVLKDSNQQTVLLYSFFDNNMLIITDKESVLQTLIARLTAEKLSR